MFAMLHKFMQMVCLQQMNTIVVFHGEFRQISYMEKNAICSFLRSRMIFTVSFESG